jgi:hypothetical protein
MPKDFDNCVKGGGKVRTIKAGGNKYMHICKTQSGYFFLNDFISI